jgi:hypothetical protein
MDRWLAAGTTLSYLRDAIQTVLAKRDLGMLAMLREHASHRMQSVVGNSRHAGGDVGTVADDAVASAELPL